MDDKTAKILHRELRYPNGASVPTEHTEYACPCGKGKVIHQCVSGFSDHSVWLECDTCRTEYQLVTGCGHIWELRKHR